MKILEIGSTPLFKTAFPEETTLVWTGERPMPQPQVNYSATPYAMARVTKSMLSNLYDVIVVSPHLYRSYHPRYWLRALIRAPWQPWSALTRAYGADYFRLIRPTAPLIIVDMADNPTIGTPTVKLLDAATAVFKRELPSDRWRVLSGTSHPFLPTRRIRQSPKWQRRINKFHPVNLPNLFPDIDGASFSGTPKTTDVFFAGDVIGNSTARMAAISDLEKIQALGYKVDYPNERLSKDEFFHRMARAWLTLSPEGFGWQCYRHAEAGMVGSIPLINYPTIIQATPFLDGFNCFYFSPEPGGLVKAVQKALTNKDTLLSISQNAQHHCTTNYTIKACCEYMLEKTMNNWHRDKK